MRSFLATLAILLALTSSGCVLGSNPRTAKAAPPVPQPVVQPAPAPPNPPVTESLSIPQTQVELPPAQPVDPDALAGAQPPEGPAGAGTPPPGPGGATTRTRRAAGPPPIAAPKPAEGAAPTGAAAPAATEPERAPIQEIVPAGELKRLQESADVRKREVRQLLEHLNGRRLNRREQGIRANVESFVRLSDEAEAKGDMRQASALAERAWILAKDLQSGR